MEKPVEAQDVEKTQNVEETKGINKVILKVSRIMAACGAIALFVMMAITVIDVGGRNIFLQPLNGAVELVGLMLILAGTWGMGYCELLKMHLRINLLSDHFGRIGRNLAWLLTLLLSAVISGLISWQAFLRAASQTTAKLGNVTDILALPLWPFTAIMGIGFIWLCFVLVVEIYQQISGAAKK